MTVEVMPLAYTLKYCRKEACIHTVGIIWVFKGVHSIDDHLHIQYRLYIKSWLNFQIPCAICGWGLDSMMM